jgi:hypothetical protein
MRIFTTLIIGLVIGASGGYTSTATAAESGSKGEGSANHQDASKAVILKSRRYGGPYCGDRVKAEEVLVIDLESPEGQASLEQAGPYELLTEPWISIESKGSMMNTKSAAIDSAASRGCNLLLTGPVVSDSMKTDSTGLASSGGSPDRLQKYLLVRMARLEK